MAYEASLEALVRTATACGVAFRADPPGGAAMHDVEVVFGAATSLQIARHGYFASDDIPWVAEHLALYDPATLAAKQRGYRTDANTGECVAGWDPAMHAIGDALADPICVAGDGTIQVSVHGRGKWTYAPVFPDLAGLYDFLAFWISYYVATRRGAVHDPDYEVLPEVRAEVTKAAAASGSPAMRDNLLAFMFD